MKPLVIGLIGCGLWGRNILRELVFLNTQPWVVEPNEEARDYALANGAEKTFETIDDLPEVDGYILSTPASLHASHIEHLLQKGKPIFTEKPFVLNLEDAQRIKQQGQGRVFVMHVWRYHPAVQKLKAIIASNRIGQLDLIRTRRCNWPSPVTRPPSSPPTCR